MDPYKENETETSNSSKENGKILLRFIKKDCKTNTWIREQIKAEDIMVAVRT